MRAGFIRSTLVKFLRNTLNLNDDTYIMYGTDDPTSVAKDAPRSSLYLRNTGSAGELYQKDDNGSTTNWTLNAASGGGGSGPGDATSVTKTAAYTLLTTDHTVYADASSASFTLTLPTAASAGDGKRFWIKKTTLGNTVTIDANGTETIDGELTIDLTVQYTSVTLMSDGSNWHII